VSVVVIVIAIIIVIQMIGLTGLSGDVQGIALRRQQSGEKRSPFV